MSGWVHCKMLIGQQERSLHFFSVSSHLGVPRSLQTNPRTKRTKNPKRNFPSRKTFFTRVTNFSWTGKQASSYSSNLDQLTSMPVYWYSQYTLPRMKKPSKKVAPNTETLYGRQLGPPPFTCWHFGAEFQFSSQDLFRLSIQSLKLCVLQCSNNRETEYSYKRAQLLFQTAQ